MYVLFTSAEIFWKVHIKNIMQFQDILWYWCIQFRSVLPVVMNVPLTIYFFFCPNVTVIGRTSRLYQPWQMSAVERLLGKNAAVASGSGLSLSKLKESAGRLSNWQLSGGVKKSHNRSAGHPDADYRGRSSGSGKLCSVQNTTTGTSSSLSAGSLLSSSCVPRSSLLLGAHLSGGRPGLQSQKYTSSDWKKPGAYRCPSCGKLYRWKKNLISHRRLECGKEPQLQCPYCPHRTKHKSSLVKHVDRLHGQSCP